MYVVGWLGIPTHRYQTVETQMREILGSKLPRFNSFQSRLLDRSCLSFRILKIGALRDRFSLMNNQP